MATDRPFWPATPGNHEPKAEAGGGRAGGFFDGTTLVDIGATTTIAGARIGVGGLTWYFAQSRTPEAPRATGFRFNDAGFDF